MAKPTTVLAAATPMVKITKICPVIVAGVRNLEKATKLMLTALNIISNDNKIPMALRLVKTP
jgi:hypothetical protein